MTAPRSAAAAPAQQGRARRLGSEAVGTGLLVVAVVGSGFTASRLASGAAQQLAVNVIATVLALGALIWALGPVSGAHFNPAVTLVALARREMAGAEAAGYVAAQMAAAVAGAVVANLMFRAPAVRWSHHSRSGTGLWLGEVVATAGLLLVIGAATRTGRARLGPVLVPVWIASAAFVTSSYSFANPAVTVARSLTDSFSGIAPASVAGFVVAQLLGAALGALVTEWLFPVHGTPPPLDLPAAVHTPPPSTSPPQDSG